MNGPDVATMNPVSKLPGYRPEIAKKALLMVLAPALLSTGLLLYLNQQWIDEGIIAKKQGKNYEIVTHEFFNMEDVYKRQFKCWTYLFRLPMAAA